MKKSYWLLISVLLSLSTSAIADTGTEDFMFLGTDIDRNERIDRTEAKTIYNLADEAVFNEFDKDKNGYISRYEFRSYIQRSPWTDIN